MPEIRFFADTHPELVRQVRVWLESTERERSAADVVEASADLTKDALRLIAAAAPAPAPRPRAPTAAAAASWAAFRR